MERIIRLDILNEIKEGHWPLEKPELGERAPPLKLVGRI